MQHPGRPWVCCWAVGPQGHTLPFLSLGLLPPPHHCLRPLGRLGSIKDLELKASQTISISLAPDSRPQCLGMVVQPPPRLQLLWGLEIISGHRDRMSGVWAPPPSKLCSPTPSGS